MIRSIDRFRACNPATRIDLPGIEAFLGVAHLGSFRRAMHLSRAALSHRIKKLEVGLRDRGSGGPERLAVGYMPTLALLHLPAALAGFGRLRPDLRVQVYDNSANAIFRRVRAGDADFGVTVTPVRGLDIAPLTQDPFVLVCPAGHALTMRAAVQWRESEGEAARPADHRPSQDPATLSHRPRSVRLG